MEIECLTSSFKNIHTLDAFSSLIWTDRFWLCGDFELHVPPTSSLLNYLINTRYFRLSESEHLMFFEDLNIHSDPEEGNELVLTGRSLESMLDRRIVWNGTALTGSFQTGIQTLLNDSIISPTDTDRDINNFVFQASTDPVITALTIDSQFIGDEIYPIMHELCRSKEIGFKITLNSSNNFQFELYAGKDRSYGQTTNPYVVFSMDFDNLLDADYIQTSRFLKTVALVEGEPGVGNTKTYIEVPAPGSTATGLERRELFVEANIIRNSPDGELTEAEYLDQLEGKGLEELAKHINLEAFDGEVDTTLFEYGVDFFMGDVVQIKDEYGHSTESRVTEIIYSQDREGHRIYPTFTTVP